MNPIELEANSKLDYHLADQVIVDLEDAIPEELKDTARAHVVNGLNHRNFWVRINNVTSSEWTHDVETLKNHPRLSGVILAKTESADDVQMTFDAFAGEVAVIPLVESALGIERATEIALADGAFRLAFGSGDYRRDTGASNDDLAMSYPRSRLMISSRVAGLPNPIDGPTITSDPKQVGSACAAAATVGMTGKLCLNLNDLQTINEQFSPTQEDLSWAAAFLSRSSSKDGAVIDGSYPPQRARAQKILQLARAYGLTRADTA
ncbi:HpcH/HpaI aldolase/citrate lyase family protein [Rhodococcus erythropolis]|uniref:HpcH/HpaI aldolase/citrate lyase family protein n=1 Tax=Rhodococcus erythropolis TaxID=1833 RepID=UPI002AD45DC9|nr:aldolase/citrate lyase family protein [Rhodococcus erythropolis]